MAYWFWAMVYIISSVCLMCQAQQMMYKYNDGYPNEFGIPEK